MHKLLRLPIKHLFNELTKFGDTCESLREAFKGKKLIIIDEMSMISQKMLGYIDRRLKDIMNNYSKPFGGFSIILAGDFG